MINSELLDTFFEEFKGHFDHKTRGKLSKPIENNACGERAIPGFNISLEVGDGASRTLHLDVDSNNWAILSQHLDKFLKKESTHKQKYYKKLQDRLMNSIYPEDYFYITASGEVREF